MTQLPRNTPAVAVIGAGTMGVGVAHCAAVAGAPVILVDSSDAALSRAEELLTQNLRLYPLAHREPPLAVPEVLGRITFTSQLDDIAPAQVVVENITESWELKEKLYHELSRLCSPGCLIGVNTSAIPITTLAALVDHPERVIGTHFMNPVPLKPMVEVIRARQTSAATITRMRDFLRGLGRDSVVVEDSSGFVTNRLAMMTVNEAVRLLEENVSTAPDIDKLMRQCMGHAMGPLETADLIGLDTVLYSLEVLAEHLGDAKFAPAALLHRMVRQGQLGRKSGQGFYTYSSPTTH